MKKLVAILLTLVLIISISIPAEAATVKISKKKAIMEKDSVLTLKITGTKDTVKWTSSNKKIAKVSSKGKVTAVSEGIATITATVKKKTYTCKVVVIDSTKTSMGIDDLTPVKMENGIPKLPNGEGYKVVSTYSYESYNYIHIVYVVNALKTGKEKAKMIIEDKNGNILDTSEAYIEATKGKQNYFKFQIEKKYIDSQNLFSFTTSSDSSFWDGETDAVEVVKYNSSDDRLYITVKQIGDNVGTFAQLKMLFFNDGVLTSSEECYYNIYADEMLKKGDTGIIEFSVYNTPFTDIVFFYEDR